MERKLKTLFTNKYSAGLVAIIAAILWGSAFPVLKVSYTEMSIAANDLAAKVILAGLRFFLASLLLFGMAFFAGYNIRVKKKHLLALVLSGILQISLQYFFFYNGLAHTSGMKGAVLSSCGTFFIFILAHLFYTNDRLSWQKIIGLSAGFAGILLVNYGKSLSPSFSLQGEGFLIIAGLASAFGTILSKKLSGNIHPLVLTAWQMLLGSVLLISLGLPALKGNAMSFTPEADLLLVYSAFLSATAFSLWYSVLKYHKAGEVSVYLFMIPVSGAILSAVFVPGEQLSLSMLGALLLVAVGIITVNYQRRIQTSMHSR